MFQYFLIVTILFQSRIPQRYTGGPWGEHREQKLLRDELEYWGQRFEAEKQAKDCEEP